MVFLVVRVGVGGFCKLFFASSQAWSTISALLPFGFLLAVL